MRVLTTLNQQRMKFDKIQKNFDLCWKSGSKNWFLTTPDLRRMKFGKIQIFSVALRIWLEIQSLTTPNLRRMTFCKVNILIHVKNLAQNWHFWSLVTCEGWNLAKSRNFQLRQTFGETFEHSGPAKDKIWQQLEILNCFKNLARKWDFWSLWTWPMIKFGNLAKSWNF